MAKDDDYYAILGVPRNAAQADIQKAYRKLARKYHPDLNPDDKSATKKFQQVQRAFDVLNDPAKRELYDRYGSSFEGVAAAGGPRPGSGWNPQGAGVGPEDVDFGAFFGERFGGDPGGIFEQLFQQTRRAQSRGRRTRAAPAAPVDAAAEATIPLHTAILGGETLLELSRDGTTQSIRVRIPPGIAEGKKIRLRGQGVRSPDGTAGDLYVTIHVAPHPHFRREGDQLVVRLPVTLREAAEGAKVDVPTPRGTVALRIPPGTSSGARLRIKGHGVARSGQEPGDLVAEVRIVLPPELGPDDLELIRQLDARRPHNPRAELRW